MTRQGGWASPSLAGASGVVVAFALVIPAPAFAGTSGVGAMGSTIAGATGSRPSLSGNPIAAARPTNVSVTPSSTPVPTIPSVPPTAPAPPAPGQEAAQVAAAVGRALST